ncbi:hypothetical protein D9611_009150 [Ephemerocybe angulata]|uniref:Uncharacterized protein n=1 Tax=Ephemerocybe angulata TaxID=980116 RepID=A0A8H5CDP6_9AGAR|nr:hypothetical protein D9611_009150 [Tulosesus angulatus]
MSSNTPLKLGDLAIADEDRSKQKTLNFLHESSLGYGSTDSIEYALGMQRGDIDLKPGALSNTAIVSEQLEDSYSCGHWALLPDMKELEDPDLLDLLARNGRVPFDQREYLPPIIHKPGKTYTYTLLFWPHIVDIRGPNGVPCKSGSQLITSDIHPVCALAGLPVFLSYTEWENSNKLLEQLISLGPLITRDLFKILPDLCRTIVPEWLGSVMGPIPSLFFKEKPDHRDNKSFERAERRETLEATIAEKLERIKALKAEVKSAKKVLETDFLPRDLEILVFMMREDMTGRYAHVLNYAAFDMEY